MPLLFFDFLYIKASTMLIKHVMTIDGKMLRLPKTIKLSKNKIEDIITEQSTAKAKEKIEAEYGAISLSKQEKQQKTKNKAPYNKTDEYLKLLTFNFNMVSPLKYLFTHYIFGSVKKIR